MMNFVKFHAVDGVMGVKNYTYIVILGHFYTMSVTLIELLDLIQLLLGALIDLL